MIPTIHQHKTAWLAQASSCPFSRRPLHNNQRSKLQTPPLGFHQNLTLMIWFFPLSVYPLQRRKNHYCFSNYGFLFINTRLNFYFLFNSIPFEYCSPPNEMMVISDNTCHLFTKRTTPIIYIFFCWALPF